MYINSIDHLNQMVPQDFISAPQISIQKDNLTIILNKDYLSDLFHYIYFRYANYYNENTENDIIFPLSSIILRKKYGNKYMHYVQYLLDESFIRKVRNYTSGSHCNTYKLVKRKIEIVGLIEYKNKDKKLIREHNKELWKSNDQLSIYPKRLINSIKKNLNSVSIDKDGAIKYLKSTYSNELHNKYVRNYQSIISIDDRNLYLTLDKHGRIHTNFTILKKDIRNQFLRIDGEVIKEKDISNSQALFFLYLLSQNLNSNINKTELYRLQKLIIDGTIYDHLASVDNELRADMKQQFFKYLFGRKGAKFTVFNKLYPNISKYIKAYKVKLGDYKLLSHHLQLLEGDFIFNVVCRELSDNKIKYFTVHDSVCVKESDFSKLDSVFERRLDELKMKIQNNIDSYFR